MCTTAASLKKRLSAVGLVVILFSGCGGDTTTSATTTASPAATSPVPPAAETQTNTWVASDPSTALLVRWTESPDGTVTGVVQQAEVTSRDNVESTNLSFDGIRQGDGVTLTVDYGLGSEVTVLGEVSGSQLTLFWPSEAGTLDPVTLQLGSIGDYNNTVAALKATRIGSYGVYVGMCLDMPESDVFYSLPEIPCTEPHDLEIFAIDWLPNSSTASYPGDDAVYSDAFDLCIESFESYVGVPYEESELFLDAFTPTWGSWEQQQDREVICVLFHVDETATSIVKTDQLAGGLRGE